MLRSIAQIIGELFRQRRMLLVRFVLTSMGRAATSMAVIFFIREFLARANAAASSHQTVHGLWWAAGWLLVTYLGGALFSTTTISSFTGSSK